MYTIKLRRDTSATWTRIDPILSSGEQGFETDTGRYKIGNGFDRWTELDSYLPGEAVLSAIDEAVAKANFDGGGAAAQEALLVHINSATPHPVYDDGPSLLLLYQNAKV